MEEVVRIFQRYSDILYEAEKGKKEGSKCRMAVIVPDLELNGAQIVLLELLRLVIKMRPEMDVYMISPSDGPYRQNYQNMGITVAVRSYVVAPEEFKHILQSEFEITLINTAACFSYVYYYINTRAKVLWWLHETQQQLSTMMNNFPNPNLLSDNITIAGVTKAVKRGIANMFSYDIEILHMPVKDCSQVSAGDLHDEVVTFVMPAAFTYIKGQDILLQAVASLPENYKNKTRFILCGYKLESQEKYYNAICNIAAKLPNVEMAGKLTREEVYKLYSKCDCVLAPSRIDATPTTIIEAMMYSKITIVSDGTGISEYMQDCVNGFVFSNENVEELMKRIMIVATERRNLKDVAEAGRKLYVENFSAQAVEKSLKEWFL